jgi:hypothetical protein
MTPAKPISAAAGEPRVFEALRRLAREGPVEVRLRGDCMSPLLADGQQVRVVAARAYWPGDVVVFRAADGRLLAHRLLGYRPRAGGFALVTRGDACAVHDAPVPPTAVLGRIETARPGLAVRARSLLRFLSLALRRRR